MAEIDVEALRGAIAALRAAVANNDTEHCEQCALSTIPGQDALICAVGGCYRLPPTLDERDPVRALLPLLYGLPDVLAALEAVATEGRFIVDQGNMNAMPHEDYSWRGLEDALHALDNPHLPADAVEREAP